MGKQARLRVQRGRIRRGVKLGNLTVEQANELYREAKGRTTKLVEPKENAK